MPILIKDYTWKQTNEKVLVRVPLRGVHPSKADVFTCENFIKVCLRDLIDDENSRCQKIKDEVIFELVKQEKSAWDVLEAPLTKSEVVAVKQNAIEISQKRHEAKKKDMQEKKTNIQRKAVSDQIALDTKERNHIDSLKELVKTTTMNELENWRMSQRKDTSNSLTITEIDKESSDDDSDTESKANQKISDANVATVRNDVNRSVNKMIFDEPVQESNTSKANVNVRTIRYNNNKPDVNKDVPSPRISGKIGVKFTPRAFPTPCRESKLAEENEWLEKQAEARRRIGFVIEDLRPEEHDPVWLKDKGDSFYKVGNYLGAICAYSHGIKLNPNLPALYSNRAAAHLALGNLRRVIQDTSKALELLTPCIELNAVSRSLCHARRGTALCQMNSLKPGLADFEEALKLCPDNEELKNDIKSVQEQLENPLLNIEEEEEISGTVDIE